MRGAKSRGNQPSRDGQPLNIEANQKINRLWHEESAQVTV